MRRPQFSLKTLLVAMLVVAAFFGGAAWQRSMCEVSERDIQKLQEDLAASEAQGEEWLQDIKWMRRQIIQLDPDFKLPDLDTMTRQRLYPGP